MEYMYVCTDTINYPFLHGVCTDDAQTGGQEEKEWSYRIQIVLAVLSTDLRVTVRQNVGKRTTEEENGKIQQLGTVFDWIKTIFFRKISILNGKNLSLGVFCWVLKWAMKILSYCCLLAVQELMMRQSPGYFRVLFSNIAKAAQDFGKKSFRNKSEKSTFSSHFVL